MTTTVLLLLGLFVGILFTSTDAESSEDEIISLPGWPHKLPSKQYSGYLKASDTSYLHYWLVLSENSPEDSPVVVWFNGGPGCSSLDGFFYEHGPFEIRTDDYQSLTLRKYRWSSQANVLYIESPVGVGYSYDEKGDYSLDDDRSAKENRAAIEYFYKLFPEYIPNQLFITGESYAGIYVPTLAQEILEGEDGNTYHGAKLTGIAVGNGCSGNDIGICGDGPQGTYYEWLYLKQSGFVPHHLKNNIDKVCDWEAMKMNKKGSLSEDCMALLSLASSKIGSVNLYNIYGDCVSSETCTDTERGSEESQVSPSLDASSSSSYSSIYRSKIPLRNFQYASSNANLRHEADADNREEGRGRRLQRIIPYGPDACIDSAAASAYLNNPAVQKAIHVKYPGSCWAVCKVVPNWTYKSTRANLPVHTYPKLVTRINVVIFNGDWDACVPYTDNEAWTESMGFPIKTPWHPWTHTSILGNTNQVAGYAVEYDVSAVSTGSGAAGTSTGSFYFVTVRGGRHEVPESAPAQASELLRRLLQNIPF